MKKTSQPFYIGGMEIKPGERKTVDLSLPGLYTHTEMAMPVQVIRGKHEGPRLFVSAAIHGDEINGVEIIRRLLRQNFLKRIHGILIAVPIVNIYGFVSHSRYLPDRRDLNRSFPGSEKGSLTARLARLFMTEIVNKCTHGIDIHTGTNNRSNLPQIRACMDEPETSRLAHAFSIPLILNANIRDGSLREAVRESGVPIIVYEGGEALRFDEVAIRMGLRGITSVMSYLGMLPHHPVKKTVVRTLIARNSLWVRSPVGGIFHGKKPLGGRVAKNEVLGNVGDPLGENELEVRSPFSGLIIGRTNIPLVNEGDPLYHVASFHLSPKLTAILKKIETELDPDFFAGSSLAPSLE